MPDDEFSSQSVVAVAAVPLLLSVAVHSTNAAATVAAAGVHHFELNQGSGPEKVDDVSVAPVASAALPMVRQGPIVVVALIFRSIENHQWNGD
jgi:hypothetical protein